MVWNRVGTRRTSLQDLRIYQSIFARSIVSCAEARHARRLSSEQSPCPYTCLIMDRPPAPLALAMAAIVVSIIFYSIYRILQIGRRPADLPPGPPTIPILGNILQVSVLKWYPKCSDSVSSLDPQKATSSSISEMGPGIWVSTPRRALFSKSLLADGRSPIYSLILGTKTVIVLSSPKTVKDLMHDRSAIYSSRPDMYLAHDVATNSKRFVTMVSSSISHKVKGDRMC